LGIAVASNELSCQILPCTIAYINQVADVRAGACFMWDDFGIIQRLCLI
jgi:hypothetical protein